jgi:ABC-type sugar transport system ATPase subunit
VQASGPPGAQGRHPKRSPAVERPGPYFVEVAQECQPTRRRASALPASASGGPRTEQTTQVEVRTLRLPPADVARLSGGERRRVALCRLLLGAPDLLLPRRADQPPRRR